MLPEIQKILYVTNLGPESPYVFRYALSLAERYDAGIYILHVLEPLSDNVKGLVEFFLTEQQVQQKREEARSHLMERLQRRLAAFCSQETCKLDSRVPDPVQETMVEEGQPAETILEKASETGADLIVMGTHRGLREGGGRLLGSTARRVVNTSRIPVLTVYTPRDKFEDLDTQ